LTIELNKFFGEIPLARNQADELRRQEPAPSGRHLF